MPLFGRNKDKEQKGSPAPASLQRAPVPIPIPASATATAKLQLTVQGADGFPQEFESYHPFVVISVGTQRFVTATKTSRKNPTLVWNEKFKFAIPITLAREARREGAPREYVLSVPSVRVDMMDEKTHSSRSLGGEAISLSGLRENTPKYVTIPFANPRGATLRCLVNSDVNIAPQASPPQSSNSSPTTSPTYEGGDFQAEMQQRLNGNNARHSMPPGGLGGAPEQPRAGARPQQQQQPATQQPQQTRQPTRQRAHSTPQQQQQQQQQQPQQQPPPLQLRQRSATAQNQNPNQHHHPQRHHFGGRRGQQQQQQQQQQQPQRNPHPAQPPKPNHGLTKEVISNHTNIVPLLSETHPECPICLCETEDGDSGRILPCMHIFHIDCVDQWLMQNGNCPMCKVYVLTGTEEPPKQPEPPQPPPAAPHRFPAGGGGSGGGGANSSPLAPPNANGGERHSYGQGRPHVPRGRRAVSRPRNQPEETPVGSFRDR